MRRWYNKACITLLKVLGFSTPMAFMACYGPPPSGGMVATEAEEWVAPADSTDQSWQIEEVDTTETEEKL
mgnify:CR=1 FL=1